MLIDECPNHVEVNFKSTLEFIIKVAHVCLKSWNRICFMLCSLSRLARSPLYMLDEHVQRLQEQRQQYIQRFAINERQPLQEDVCDDYNNVDISDMEDIFEDDFYTTSP